MANGGAVYEAGVTLRSSRVEGTLSLDLEAGSVGWYPLGARTGDAIGLQDDDDDDDGDSGSCGGCLTWEGIPSLPLEIHDSDLVGALGAGVQELIAFLQKEIGGSGGGGGKEEL